jgi:hypothetical protein
VLFLQHRWKTQPALWAAVALVILVAAVVTLILLNRPRLGRIRTPCWCTRGDGALSEADKIKRYAKLVEARTPGSKLLRDCFRAFWVGGLICAIGQAITIFGSEVLHLNVLALGAFTPSVLVFLGTTLTGLGVYDRIGEYAGRAPSCPSRGLPTPWPRRPWSSGGRGWCWAWGRSFFCWPGR